MLSFDCEERLEAVRVQEIGPLKGKEESRELSPKRGFLWYWSDADVCDIMRE